MNRYDQYASSCSGHLDQFVSDDRLSDEMHTNGYTQIHTDEQTHTHKHTPTCTQASYSIHPPTHSYTLTDKHIQSNTHLTYTHRPLRILFVSPVSSPCSLFSTLRLQLQSFEVVPMWGSPVR